MAGLATVAGGDVGPGEAVQALQQVTGVGDVAPHRRVGPRGVRVAVEPQVQLHQAGHLLGGVLVEGERLQAPGGHLRAHRLVEAESDGASLLEAAGGGLADVVQQRGQAQHQVRALAGPTGAGLALQVDGLVQHGEGVLVHVLVPVVLIELQLHRRQLRQHVDGQSQVHHQLQAPPGVLTADQAHQLLPHPLRGDDGDAVGERLDGRGGGRVQGEAQLGDEAHRTHHPQGVVVEGLLRSHGGAQHTGGQIGQTVEGIHQVQRGDPHGHRVDGEVAAGEVTDQGVAEGHLGLAAGGVVGLRAVGGDLHLHAVSHPAQGAELPAHVPDRAVAGPRAKDRLGVVRSGGGGEVQVGAGAAQHRVPHRPAHQGQLEARVLETAAQVMDLLGQGPEHGRSAGARDLQPRSRVGMRRRVRACGASRGIGHGCPVLGGSPESRLGVVREAAGPLR